MAFNLKNLEQMPRSTTGNNFKYVTDDDRYTVSQAGYFDLSSVTLNNPGNATINCLCPNHSFVAIVSSDGDCLVKLADRTYQYFTADTIADVTASGYFAGKNYSFDADESIKVQASDGPYEVQLVGGVASVVGGEIFAASSMGDKSNFDSGIEKINAIGEAYISALDASEPSNFGLTKSGVTVVFDGEYEFSNTLVLWPSIRYVINKGSVLKALVNGQTIVRTPTTAEFRAATGTTYFDRKGLSLTGRGIIDGDNKASMGLLLDTLASGTDIDVVVSRCTYRKYDVTCSKTNGSPNVTVSDATGVAVYDTVEINDDGRFYTVLAVSGTSVTLDRNVQGTDAAATFKHRATGVSSHQCQQGNYCFYTTYCDVGEVYTKNVDGVDCTDMILAGEARRCEIGIISKAMSECLGMKTVIKCYEENMVFANGDGSSLNLYIESLNDADADGDTTPTGGSPVTAAGLRAYPLIDILANYNALSLNIVHPMNASTTTWRRLIRNAGGNTVVNRVATRVEAKPENPDRSGDYAFVEQNNSLGQIRLEGVVGPTNLSTIAEKLVVTEAGARPSNFRASWSCVFNSRYAESVESAITYVTNVGSRAREYFSVGESFARCAIGSGGLFLGNGTANPERVIRYQSGVLIDDWLNVPNTEFLRLQQPNGTWRFFWVDNAGDLRISSTEPADRNTDGTVVGTQS